MNIGITHILFTGILLGGPAMAQPPFYHQKMLDEFKREIRFEQLLNKLPKDKIVLVNWGQAIKEFKDAEGTTWRGDISTVFGADDFGHMSASLESSQGTINIQISSMRDGQREAIEHALREAATTSMPYINSRVYEPCFADFCLTLRDSPISSRFRFVYGNIYVWLDYVDVDDKDVLPVARYLQSVMEKVVVANPDHKLPARPKTAFTISPTQIKAGETFTVTVKPGAGYQKALWYFDVAQDQLSDNVEYEEDLGDNVYKFTAKAPGPGTVAFNLMDKKTLWVFTDTVTVNIEPKK